MTLLAACGGEVPTGSSEPLRVADAGLPGATRGVPYEADVQPVGGLRPYSFTVEEGELPPGLGLQGGRILGTPSEVGSFDFTVAVSDATLSSTFRSMTLEVTELPTPELVLAPPDTMVRGPTTLRLRVEEAFDFRGASLAVRWDPERFTLVTDSVLASRDRFRAFFEVEPGLLRLDVAVLGESLTGEADLARFTLEPEAPSELGLEWDARVAYADRRDHLAGAHEPAREDESGEDDAAEVDEGAADDERDGDGADEPGGDDEGSAP